MEIRLRLATPTPPPVTFSNLFWDYLPINELCNGRLILQTEDEGYWPDSHASVLVKPGKIAKHRRNHVFFFGFTPLWDHSNRMFSCFNLGGMGLHTSICASRIASLTSWHALPHVQHNPFSGVHGELFKGSWEAILPCYGQIELWD